MNSKKVYLKEIDESYTDLIVSWRNNPLVLKYFIDQRELTPSVHLNWLREYVYKKKVYQFIIIDCEDDKPVGSVFLKDVDLDNKKAEYGIFIGENSKRGKGFGTDAARQILDFAFNTLCLNKVYLRVLSDNVSGIKSYQKAGFKIDKTHKEEVNIGGKPFDVLFMSCLKNEFHLD